MEDEERVEELQHLLAKDTHEVPGNTPNCRHFLLMPALFLTAFGGTLSSYVQSEWTQSQISKKYLNNTTTNFSTCVSHNISDPVYQNYEDVQKETAKWLAFYSLAELIPVILAQLFLPSFTDYSGRKFLLILTITGLSIKAAGVTIAVAMDAHFWLLVIFLSISGCTGTFFGLLAVSFSFLADLTLSQRYRTTAIVVVEALLLVAVVISSYLSGFFIETINLGFFYTSLIGTIINIGALLLLFLTPESLPKNRRSPRRSFLKTVQRMTDFYVSSDFKGHRKAYILLLLSFAMAVLANMNRSSMETLYFLGQPFCWGPSKIGIFATVKNATLALTAFTVPILQYLMSDTTIAILSTVSNAGSFVIEAFATTTLLIYMVPLSGMFGFLVIPMIRGLMSSMTSTDKQGAMFAGIATIEVTGSLIGNLSQNAIYTFTLSFMKGFVFLILALMSVINFILLCIYKCVRRNGTSYEIIVKTSDGATQ